MRRMMILFIALTIAFLIPFLIWGHAWEWSTDQALQQLPRYGALAAPILWWLIGKRLTRNYGTEGKSTI